MRHQDQPTIKIRSHGPTLCFVGGSLLALCLFMPAVEGVGIHERAIRPIELPFAAWPHFMGVFAAMGTLLFWLRDEAGAAVMGLVVQILDVAAACGMCILLSDHIPVVTAATLVLLWLSLSSFRQHRCRLARSAWISGLLSCVWLGYLWVFQGPRYGLWLAFLGALLLVAGGTLFERDMRQTLRDRQIPWAVLTGTSTQRS